jgi:hypothetical protein
MAKPPHSLSTVMVVPKNLLKTFWVSILENATRFWELLEHVTFFKSPRTPYPAPLPRDILVLVFEPVEQEVLESGFDFNGNSKFGELLAVYWTRRGLSFEK